MYARHRIAFAIAARVAIVAAAAAGALGGCSKIDPIAAPQPVTGQADFASYVALGTSVSMGFQSGGLLGEFQANSFPALVARQAGANGGSFTQPLVDSPGLPPVLELTGLTPSGSPILTPRPGTPPAGPTTPRPADGYDNLAMAGASVASVISRGSGDPYYDLVLQGQGSALRQCLAQQPTFITVELGASEAILPVFRGSSDAIVAPAIFQALYVQLMDSLAAAAPQAKLALLNVPDATDLPYATTVPLSVTIPGPGGAPVTVRLRDAEGPLPDGSLILLPASTLIQLGSGFPPPAPPLPDSVVIRPAERAAIRAAIEAYNDVIAQQAQARGAALVDAYGLYKQADAEGIEIAGVTYRTRFVTGGLFSFDGFNPTTVGNGVLANTVIDAINRKFGARIPPADLRVLTLTGNAGSAGSAATALP